MTNINKIDLTYLLKIFMLAFITVICLSACSKGVSSYSTGNTTSASYALNLASSGGGTVTSLPAGINCGTICSASFNQDTSVTLTAATSSGFTFTGWSGDCTGATTTCTTTMSAARSVTAAFSQSPTANSAYITLSLVPSLSSGVAPLSVFFDTSLTTATATTRPFHDLEYRWNFGDTTAGTWGYGTKPGTSSKNLTTGPEAAHIFETPGTYTVTLTAFDGTDVATKTATITVTDPATLTTACVANGVTPSAGAGGCPANATLFYNTSSFNTALTTAITAGAKRVLFRNGDTFTSSAQYEITATGPGIIGSYGTATTSPNILVSAAGQSSGALSFNAADWRVIDLAFDGTGTVDQFAFKNSGVNQLTLLRVSASHFEGDINFNNMDQMAVVDSSFTFGGSNSSGSNYGVWCGICTRVMLLGNYAYLNTINSHNARMQGVNKFVVSNNTLIGSNLIEPITVRGNTQYGMLSDNKFVDNIVTIKPQNSASNEYQHDIIFERDWFVAGSNTGPALDIEGSGITIRNNIFDLSAVAGAAINIASNNTAGAPKPDIINMYNNTIYNSLANNGNLSQFNVIAYFGNLDANCHSELKNNLAYSPNTINVAPTLIGQISGSPAITGAAGTFGNSSNSQMKTSPSFASATPVSPTDFVIGAGSYARNGGVAVPVFSDFFGTVRPKGNTLDMGAIKGP
jgi:uncharacterized repeat protein (TIGR02543 family)